jgi:hypothetical protein
MAGVMGVAGVRARRAGRKRSSERRAAAEPEAHAPMVWILAGAGFFRLSVVLNLGTSLTEIPIISYNTRVQHVVYEWELHTQWDL